MAEPAGSVACADAIGIEATPKDQAHLRRLLRQGSLAELRHERCQDYIAQLVASSTGWSLTMRRTNSTRQLERQVTSIKHAATWIESWMQSGFAPTLDDRQETANNDTPVAGPSAPTTGADKAIATPPAAGARSPTPIGFFAGVLPSATVTSHGFALLGGTVFAGVPAQHTPWFGAEFGAASQIDMAPNDYRRMFWAGPLLGTSTPMGARVRFRAAATVGLVGTVAHTSNATAHAIALDAGLFGDLEFDLATDLAFACGLESRVLFESLFGSASTSVNVPCSDDDCGEDGAPTSTTVALPSRPGRFIGALRLGLIYRFGGKS